MRLWEILQHYNKQKLPESWKVEGNSYHLNLQIQNSLVPERCCQEAAKMYESQVVILSHSCPELSMVKFKCEMGNWSEFTNWNYLQNQEKDPWSSSYSSALV